MPELPEVRTVAKVLKNKLLNKTVTGIKIIYGKTVDQNSLDLDLLIGKSLKDIKTMGKYLLFDFDEYLLVSHLRMEGKYFLKSLNDQAEKHEHVIFNFADVSLRYHDTRKFGRMQLLKAEDLDQVSGLKKLAPEPFTMSQEFLYEKLNKKLAPMKSLLLDQTIISGLGNIYADEVLFAARIHPLRMGRDVKLSECEKIISSATNILNESIAQGGTTIKSYTSSLGVVGNYQAKLKVHTKANSPCQVCQTLIERIKVGGRSTYFCPQCQK